MPEDQRSSRGARPGARDLLRHAPAAVLAIIIVAFAIDNHQKVRVGFVFTDSKVPLVFVLVATTLIGVAIGALLAWRRR